MLLSLCDVCTFRCIFVLLTEQAVYHNITSLLSFISTPCHIIKHNMTLFKVGYLHSFYTKLIKTNHLDQHALKCNEIVKKKEERERKRERERERTKITRCK